MTASPARSTDDDARAVAALEARWARIDTIGRDRDAIQAVLLVACVLVGRWSFRDLAWALWTHVAWVIALSIVVRIGVRLVGRDRSGIGAARFGATLLGEAIGPGLAWIVLGALLSFFAEHTPAELLGRNGFVNRDPRAVLAHTSARYWPILALSVNQAVFVFRATTMPHGPRAAAGGIAAQLMGAFLIASLVGVGAVMAAGRVAAESAMLVVYAAWFCVPWRWLTRDSVQDTQAERRPTLYAGSRLPLRSVDRAGIGFVVVALGLTCFFGIGALAVAAHAAKLVPASTASALVLGFVAVGLFAVSAFLAAVSFTAARATRCATVTEHTVVIAERTWSAPHRASLRQRLGARFVARQAELSLRDYERVVVRVDRRRDSDSVSHDDFRIVLEHATNEAANVVLYRAPHDANVPLLARHFAAMLGKPRVGAEPRDTT